MSSSTKTETGIIEINNGKDSVASRKLAAAEYRRNRKAAREPRNRLLSDSSDEVPKGILKNARIPTKRSVSECVDDLSQIMADLDLNIHDLPKATGKFCLYHQYIDEKEEYNDDDCDYDYDDDKVKVFEVKKNPWNGSKFSVKCDCNLEGDKNKNKSKYLEGGDEEDKEEDDEEKPKKSVRFDEKVYETVFFASRLYDRRYFSKYHFSTRHHPQNNHKQNNNNKSNKKNRQRSKSESDGDLHRSYENLKSDNSCHGGNGCKLSKSQRAKQSKKDKKRRLNNKKEDSTESNSDDQGYHSHSFSD